MRQIVVVASPGADGAKPYALGRTALVVGRAPERSPCVRLVDDEASRSHASIEYVADEDA